jgi:tRNA threonylcarbamoyladenosine biosynthesis protein TsaB
MHTRNRRTPPAAAVVGEFALNARMGEKSWTHSEILMPGVEQLFKLTRIEPGEIDYVAYTCGPGSFTGLRIGAACALGIARALNKPVIAVPTLDALAYNITGEGLIVPMLDARRGQVYTALYKACGEGLERQTDYLAMPAEEFIQAHLYQDKKYTFLGEGADANAEAIRRYIPGAVFANASNNRTRAASAGVCAAEKIHSGCVPSAETEILYVRAPQAVREAKCLQL